MLRLRTLGGLDLRSADGQQLGVVLAQPKRTALLCYLALAKSPRPQRRDTLVGLFWPEHDQAHARHALRQSIYFLRQALGEGVLSTGGEEEVAVEPAGLWCDAVAFEAAVAAGRPADALALYAGDLLPGFFADAAQEFESWLEAERERLRGLAAEAAWQLAGQKEQAGDAAAAVSCGRRAAALMPGDEATLRRLMLLLERQGDRAGALRAYHAFAWKLEQELEVQPSAETTSLAEALRLRALSTPSTPGPETLPAKAAPPAAASAPATAAWSFPHSRAARVLVALAVGTAVLTLGLFAYVRNDRPAAADPAAPALAVLPAEVHGLDAYLREGMVDLLASSLDGAGGLRAINSRTVLARWREHFPPGVEPDLAATLAVARAAGARWAVVPVATRVGDRVRLSARTYDVAAARQLGDVRVDAPPESLSVLIERMSIQVAASVAGRGGAPAALPAGARIGTTSLPALRAYLQGRALERQSAFRAAAAQYEQALALDSSFALAWRGFWHAALWSADYGDRMPRILARTVALLTSQSPRDRAFARMAEAVTQSNAGMIGLARQAGELYPDDPEISLQLGELIWHRGVAGLVDLEEAVTALDRAIQLDPQFVTPYFHRIEYAIRTADTLALGRLLPAAALALPPEEHANEYYLREFRVFPLLAAALRDSVQGMPALRAFADTGSMPVLVAAAEALGWGGLGLPSYSPPAALRVAEEFTTRAWRRASAGREYVPAWDSVGAAMLSGRAATVSLALGRVMQARAVSDDRQPLRALHYYRALRTGQPLPSALLDSVLAVSAGDTTIPARLRNLVTGAYAAELGDWDGHRAALANAQVLHRRLLVSGDTAGGRAADLYRRALLAYGEARRGQRARAIRGLEQVLAAPLPGSRLPEVIRWWLGELYLAEERPDAALRCFAVLAGEPLAQLRLGSIHERLGHIEAARTAYQRAVAGWYGADPGFPPLEEARAALARVRPRRN